MSEAWAAPSSLNSSRYSTRYFSGGITFITDQPKRANRMVSMQRLNRSTEGYYEMGPQALREAVIVFNQETKLTPDNTIDYYI